MHSSTIHSDLSAGRVTTSSGHISGRSAEERSQAEIRASRPFRSRDSVPPVGCVTLQPTGSHFHSADLTDEHVFPAAIGGNLVLRRGTCARCKGVHKSLPQIALELNADAVVEGTVIKSGNNVRITGQLIEAATDRHLWAQSYEGEGTRREFLRNNALGRGLRFIWHDLRNHARRDDDDPAQL